MIVDDSESFRDLLRLELGADHTRQAATILEGLRLAKRDQPEVILLDHWFDSGPLRQGIDAIPLFRGVAPDSLIVMMTVDGDDGDVARATRAGAAGYVIKGDMARLWWVLAELVDIEPEIVTASSASSSPHPLRLAASQTRH